MNKGYLVMATATKQTRGPMSPKPRKELTAKEKRTPRGKFATHLRELLEARGITSAELAKKLDIKEPTVRYWLRGETFPDIETLAALGKILGLEDYRQVLPPL